ncbi:MAG: hypothetical protein IJT38_05695 [Clostridia bacterium]|nr:hypothetical protein [Clostridia bacterium]
MAVKVRDTLEKLGYDVSYDPDSGGVVVSNGGKSVNLGSDGFTLKNDGRYYAQSANDVYSALAKNGLGAGKGFKGVRNYLGGTDYVGYNDKTGQMTLNGKAYNLDGENLVKIGDKIYGKTSYLNSIRSPKYENNYESTEQNALDRLSTRKYEGYDPERDTNYQNAFDDFMKSAKADMGSRGLISDSLASYYASQGAKRLMPEFENAHYKRYLDENSRLRDVIDAARELSESDVYGFRANTDAEKLNAQNHAEYISQAQEKDAESLQAAINRTKALGYVTEGDSKILGVPAGTPSYEAQNAAQNRQAQRELKEIEEQGKYTDYELWQKKQDRELADSITLAEKQALFRYLYK